jgi:hypothetical protein
MRNIVRDIIDHGGRHQEIRNKLYNPVYQCYHTPNASICIDRADTASFCEAVGRPQAHLGFVALKRLLITSFGPLFLVINSDLHSSDPFPVEAITRYTKGVLLQT